MADTFDARLINSILGKSLSDNVEDRRGPEDDEIRAMMEYHPLPEMMRSYGRTPTPLYTEPEGNPLLDQLRRAIASGNIEGAK